MRLSKKLVAAVVTAVLVLVLDAVGIGEETSTEIVAIAAAYIIGQGAADFGKHAKETQVVQDVVDTVDCPASDG